MGFFAIEPETNELIHVSKWKIKYPETNAVCEVCEKELSIWCDSHQGMQEHFHHNPNSNSPLSDKNGKRYEGLYPTESDEENAKKIRRLVFANLWQVYKKYREIIEGDKKGGRALLRQVEFREMLEKADKKNIWAYKDLTLKYVPYILLVNYGMFGKGNARKRKVHFVFHSEM